METGKMCWFDYPVRDGKKAMQFYTRVLGWQFIPGGEDYWMIRVGTDIMGALRKESDKEFEPTQGAVCYFAVPSVKEGRKLVTEAGGKLIGDAIAILGDKGNFQLFTDLDGNRLALWSLQA